MLRCNLKLTNKKYLLNILVVKIGYITPILNFSEMGNNEIP